MADPVFTPVRIPPAIVATAVLLLNHEVPPDVASVNVVVLPTHVVIAPKIGDGTANTVTGLVA